FDLDGVTAYRVENSGPYALAGDVAGNYNAWTPSVGVHTLTASAFEGASASGGAVPPLAITFTSADAFALKAAFVEGPEPEAAAGATGAASPAGTGKSCGLLGLEGFLLAALRRRRC